MQEGDIRVVPGPTAILGEGPSWDATTKKLYWVDIKGHQLHVFDPVAEKTRTYDVGQYVTSAVPRHSGGVVLTLQHGFYGLDLDTSELTLLARVEKDPLIRFNDGKCDPAGRYWAGTMSIDHMKGNGKLYCLDTDGTVRTMLDEVTISNGLGWSPDHGYMYYIDTPERKVFAFDYDVVTGDIQNRRVVVDIPHGDGEPDGLAVDTEGMLWVAHLGASKVSRWDPRTGARLQTVYLPVQRVTSCVFGGEQLRTLFITTAKAKTLSDVRSSKERELQGRMFCCSPKVAGLPTYSYKG